LVLAQRPTSAQVDRRRLAGKWESPRQSQERVEVVRPEDLGVGGGIRGGGVEKSATSSDDVSLLAVMADTAHDGADAAISNDEAGDNDYTDRHEEFFRAQKVMKDKEAQEREEERMAELASMSPGERALLEQKEAEEAEHEKQKQKALKQMAKSLGGGKKKNNKKKKGGKKKKGRMSVASK
jgi:hypothetical protein